MLLNAPIARLALLFATCLVGCDTTLETTSFPVPTGEWYVANQVDQGKGVGTLTEAVPSEETIDDWSQMISIQSLESLKGQESEEVLHELFANQLARYTHVQQNLIESDAFSVLYEWILTEGGSHPEQHELARLIEGNQAIHRVAYTKKGPPLSDADRSQWLTALRGASLVRDGKPITRE